MAYRGLAFARCKNCAKSTWPSSKGCARLNNAGVCDAGSRSEHLVASSGNLLGACASSTWPLGSGLARGYGHATGLLGRATDQIC